MPKIIVCMKQVIDPEVAMSLFGIDPNTKRAIPPKGTPPVLNPFDENALEAALKIKDAGGADITVISMGQRLSKPILRGSLAAGADQLILLEDESFTDFDSYFTAHVLATAIKKAGGYDLILCGRQAGDTDAGQVALGIAEILGILSIPVARKIEVNSSKLIIERIVSDGYEVVEASMPCLITVGGEIGELREPSVEALMKASKKPTIVWKPQDLGIDLAQLRRDALLKLLDPPSREAKCEFVAGGTPEEAGVNLALKLKEAKIV
jgi:electron transfer flavoprotein beta subunit